LLQRLGFREVGVYEKHGQLDGVWRDVVIVEYLLPQGQTSTGAGGESGSVTNAQESRQTNGIEAARPSDFASVLSLLARVGLPQEGLVEVLSTTIVARQASQVIGCAALEVYGTVALLRSVAVDSVHRSHGLGRQLVEAQLEEAHRRGIQEVYLLTETASDYFPRFGFRPIERSAVAPALHASVEWTTACPASAQAMVLHMEEG